MSGPDDTENLADWLAGQFKQGIKDGWIGDSPPVPCDHIIGVDPAMSGDRGFLTRNRSTGLMPGGFRFIYCPMCGESLESTVEIIVSAGGEVAATARIDGEQVNATVSKSVNPIGREVVQVRFKNPTEKPE